MAYSNGSIDSSLAEDFSGVPCSLLEFFDRNQKV